ncbi:hypothetical protein ACXN5S_19345 [Pseudoroseicyclus sp. H15]
MTRPEIPAADLDPEACRRLWIAVLRACIAAVAYRAAGRTMTTRAHALGIDQVGRSWIGSRDFHLVASLAGLDGKALAGRLRAQLACPGAAAALLDVLQEPQDRRTA